MSTTTPVAIAAGFAAVTAALTLPQAMFPTEAKHSMASVMSASFSFFTTPLRPPVVKSEERLLPSDTAIDDGTNGCGMMKGVDVCSPDYMKSYLERQPTNQ